jgi:hypothetical protein
MTLARFCKPVVLAGEDDIVVDVALSMRRHACRMS